MNVGAIIVGVVMAASGVVCLFLANYQYMELQFELNERLPQDQKFEPLIWTIATHQQFRQLRRKFLPESPRPKRALRFAVGGFCLFFAGVSVLLLFSNLR